MDYTRPDRGRQSPTPLQPAAVESFARGTISRREFVRRGLLVGLTMPSITAVIAACSTTTAPGARQSAAAGGTPAGASAGSSAAAPSGSAAAVKTGGSIKVACQKPVTLDPIA